MRVPVVRRQGTSRLLGGIFDGKYGFPIVVQKFPNLVRMGVRT